MSEFDNLQSLLTHSLLFNTTHQLSMVKGVQPCYIAYFMLRKAFIADPHPSLELIRRQVTLLKAKQLLWAFEIDDGVDNSSYNCLINIIINLASLLIQMELLWAQESLYSQSQLLGMDRIIEENMDRHLQQLIQSKMATLLHKQMADFKAPPSISSQLSLEENVFNLVNQLNENWTNKQETYMQEISQQRSERQGMIISIAEKEQLIGTLNNQINEKDEAITYLTKQNHSLNSFLYILKQEMNTQKFKILEESSKHQEQMHQMALEIQRLSADFIQRSSENERLVQQNQRLKEQWDLIKGQLCSFEQWLVDDLHLVNLNSVTSNILANSINETHEQNLRQLEKYVTIHKQHVQIAKLLANVAKLTKIGLLELGQFTDNQSVYNLHQFDSFDQSLRQIQQILLQFESKMAEVMIDYEQSKKEIGLKTNSITLLQLDYRKVCNELELSASQCKTLHEALNKQRSDHYNTLMDVQKNKSKLQDLLFQNMNKYKQLQQKCLLLQQTIKQKDVSYEDLQQKLQKNQIQKQQLMQALKQQQKTSYQLRQQMLNMKSNLQIMVKTEGDDDDSNFNIVQQLIDKNNDITAQLTLKKMQIDLKEEKIAYQERLIDQVNQQIESLNNQGDKLRIKISMTVKQLSAKQQEIKTYVRDIQMLKYKIDQLSKRPAKMMVKDLKDMQTQTDQAKPQTVQSRIRRQNIKQSVGCSIQKSHSLLSQREQNKQNSECLNKTLVSTRQKDYKEKITTLNQIINFMMNYAKGLSHGELCRGSWFMSQINKHGEEYEERLMDSAHLGPKIKNAKFIEGLCRQDGNCSKLVKEFQAIIDFYTNCSSKLNSSMDGSSMKQERFNKTINKSRHPPQPSPFF